MDDYKDIKDLLRPKRDIKASQAFREKIECDMRHRGHAGFGAKWLWRGLTVGAAAVALVLLLMPTGLSAKEILTDAIASLRESSRIDIKADVRTVSREIFDYINPNSDFVEYDIIVHRSDSTTYWYVNKGERTAEKNADGLYVWIAPYNFGWHYTEHDYNVLGYFNILLSPDKILESELQYTLSAPEAKYDIAKRNGEIILTIHQMPTGDYANPYVLNTAVEESESIRRYVLDAQDHRLKSASVSMVVDGQEIEVLKITDIDYAPADKALPPIPADIKFIEDVGIASPSGIPGLDARETASVFLNALNNWDTEILHKFLNPTVVEELYRPRYEGAQLLSLGVPFQSGANPHLIFVPYTLRLRDGQIQKTPLVLANYSDAWLFDGGL